MDEHIKVEQTQVDNKETANNEALELQIAVDDSVFAHLPVYGNVAGRPQPREEIHEVAVRLQDLWHCLKTKKDLLRLLNVALTGLYGEQSSMLTMNQLNRYAYSTLESKRYTTFKIPKKKQGEFRTIDAPVPMLKYIQRGLNFVLQCVYTPHASAMGFVQHRSVVDNAKVHTGQRLVYNIDLKDFFSIHHYWQTVG